jgi:hypothetical protein
MASDQPPSPPPENELDPETRAVIDRAEAAWRRQVEREERSLDYPGPMTPFRWVLVAIAAISLIVLLLTNRFGG